MKRLSRADSLALTSLACATAALFLAFRDLAVDDAFVTYRYAFNLAHQQGYFYNSGAVTLSTTAPFYGLVLALFAFLGFDAPIVSNIVGALSIGAGGMLLFAIGRRHARVRLGWIAGMLYVLNPLLWLSLGMETAFILALVLAAFAADENGMPAAAGLALSAAFVTRYDAALPAAILFFWRLWRSPRSAIWMACVGVIAAAPVLVFLTLTFGTPMPVTLLAKRAQNVLGVTGFYAGTNFVQGLVILLHGWFEQTWLYALSAAAVVGGLVSAVRRERWILPYALWACVHFAAYILLGSAPYYWYYAPLVPAAVWIIALAWDWGFGIGEWRLGPWVPSHLHLSAVNVLRGRFSPEQSRPSHDARSLDYAPQSFDSTPLRSVPLRMRGSARDDSHLPIPNPQSLIFNLLLILAFAPFIYSLASMWQAQSGPLPESTADVSKVLPEAKVEVYRRVGEWMAANTPPTATLGATEIGVMGYYARRDVIDFLGLLQPDVASALARGDPSWALYAYQPDYVALDAVNPIYTFDPRGDDWFRAAYRPVQRFDDERFWGSPMALYRRETPRALFASASLPTSATPVDALFGDGIRLVGVDLSAQSLHPGEPLAVRLWWRAMPLARDHALSVQLLGQDDLVIAQRESQLPMTAHPTIGSSAGATISEVALIGLPETACAPDSAQLNIVLYDRKTGVRLPVTDASGRDTGDAFRLGRLSITRRGDSGDQVDISFGRALTLVSIDVTPRSVEPGETIRLTQKWRAGAKWQEGLSVFVHLVSDDGRIVAEADGAASLTGEDVRDVKVPAGTGEGVYRLFVGVYPRDGGKRLPWLDAVGQPQGDSLALCPVRVR